jgi:hypothetical protein
MRYWIHCTNPNHNEIHPTSFCLNDQYQSYSKSVQWFRRRDTQSDSHDISNRYLIYALHSKTGWATRFQSRREAGAFLVIASRPAVGSNKPPLRRVSGAFYPGLRSRNLKLTIHLRLVSWLRMRGVLPPLHFVFLVLCLSSGTTFIYLTLHYEGVSKSFRTGRLERELQVEELSATKCNFITIF